MSWKKNGISYLVWVIYVLAVGIGLVCLANAACDYLEVQSWLGMMMCGIYIVLAGLIVYLIHRHLSSYRGRGDRERIVRAVAEASVAVIILAVGLVLRVEGMDNAGEKAAYYEAASVASGQGIPQVVQGAVYFYIRLLHAVFYFLGNKFIMGIWLQILLQFGAALLLYFAVRHCAGKIASIVLLAFCMFSPYMIQEALMLSPEMLYLLFWSAALLLIVTQNGRRFRIFEFLLTGAVTAFVCYLDAAGLFLVLFTVAVLLCRREENPGSGRKALALLLYLLGVLLCFTGCIAADAYLSGKTFTGVFSAWVRLYSPGSFSIPVALETARFPVDYIILVCIMALGIFSFWRDKGKDRIMVWVLGAAVAIAAGCFGIFTPQMPVGVYLYLFVIILAGIGVEECFRRVEPAEILLDAYECAEGQAESPAAVRGTEKMQTGTGNTDDGKSAESISEEPEFLDLEPLPETRRRPVQFIENPLPLPKKHKKRSLDYSIREVDDRQDDFDLQIDENDDFDI